MAAAYTAPASDEPLNAALRAELDATTLTAFLSQPQKGPEQGEVATPVRGPASWLGCRAEYRWLCAYYCAPN